VPASHEVRKELELIFQQGSARISLTERNEFEEALAEAARAIAAKSESEIKSELLITG
jgi:hypothetical protein